MSWRRRASVRALRISASEEWPMMSKRGVGPALAGAAFLSALAIAWPGGAGERADKAGALPADLALVAADAPAFVSVRVADLLKGGPGKKVLAASRKDFADGIAAAEAEVGVPLAQIERLTVVLAGEGVALVVRTSRPYDRARLLRTLGGDVRTEKVAGKDVSVGARRVAYLVDGQVFVKTSPRTMRRLLAEAPKRTGPLAQALDLAASKKHQVVLGLSPAAVFEALGDRPGAPPGGPRPSLEKMLAELPVEALPFKPLFQARALTATLDAGDELRLSARLDYPDEDTARDGATALKTALYVGREVVGRLPAEVMVDARGARQVRELARVVQQALKSASVEQRRGVVRASARLKVEPAHLAATTLALRAAALRAQSSNNLKQLALAMHNYHDAYGAMPANASYNKDGKALLSWRVAILPFIEEAALYKEFKLDEAWDSPHNKKLLKRIPKVYASVAGKAKVPYGTFYQVFTGPNTPFNPAAIRPGPVSLGPRFASFIDGTSNTLLIVEADEAVPWSKPDDIAYDPKKPVPKLGGQFADGFFAAFADGSVRFLRKDGDAETMRNLINPADGNVIDLSKVLPRGVRP
jgi:hypothetical protein